jgi:retron-type reverse transcriptase
MAGEYPTVRFERFSDDVVIHCVSDRQARRVRDAVARRLAEVGLELHPDKTRIVYCGPEHREEQRSFTFCG